MSCSSIPKEEADDTVRQRHQQVLNSQVDEKKSLMEIDQATLGVMSFEEKYDSQKRTK